MPACEAKLLTQQEVDKYVRRDSRLKLLQKAHEEHKKDLKEALLGGAKCPGGGPFLLAIQEQARIDLDWKMECLLLMQEMYGEDEGLKRFEQREREAPRLTVRQLAIKRNLLYAASR